MSENLPTYVTISRDASFDLSRIVQDLNPDKIGLLVDENTKKYCLPLLKHSFDLIIEISSGEEFKNLTTSEQIWKQLTSANFSRKSILVNLGGGVIGDMGGFVAATFKRGIRFVNIPTTLLSQVDASIGGKLGIDFGGLKNHIGLFKNPDHVIVDARFLKTLPDRELRSGYAEVIKHSLIHDARQWTILNQHSFESLKWDEIIPKSIEIKNNIVNQDPLEGGLRKILNFGHTLGHAIESHFLTSKNSLLHGEAVAVGMILESHLSMQLKAINEREFEEITNHILERFDLPTLLPSFYLLTEYLKHDKKNSGDSISFSLLKNIGKCNYDVKVSDEMIQNSLLAYDQMKRSF